MATEVFAVALYICGPSVWILLHVTLLAPRILRQLPDFCKNVWTLGLYVSVNYRGPLQREGDEED